MEEIFDTIKEPIMVDVTRFWKDAKIDDKFEIYAVKLFKLHYESCIDKRNFINMIL